MSRGAKRVGANFDEAAMVTRGPGSRLGPAPIPTLLHAPYKHPLIKRVRRSFWRYAQLVEAVQYIP